MGLLSLGLSLMWLGDYLASHGYIVAAVNHHGNTAAEGQFLPQGFSLVWETSGRHYCDSYGIAGRFGLWWIDRSEPDWGGWTFCRWSDDYSDCGRSLRYDALVGYCNSSQSAGDATCEPRDMIRQTIAQMEALKKTDPVVQESFRHEKEPHRDPRMKAVFAMAPAIGPAFTKKDLSGINIPVQIVVGAADDVAPRTRMQTHYARLIKGAKLTVIRVWGTWSSAAHVRRLGRRSWMDVAIRRRWTGRRCRAS